jgi:hypothetical protein
VDDLIAFLRERWDEDEQVASAAKGHSVFDGTGIVTDRNESVVVGSHVATHIARHDPARVLADVSAKRQILDHLAYEWSSPILRYLALPYAGHPSFKEEWRP